MRRWEYTKELVNTVLRVDPAATSFWTVLLFSPGVKAQSAHFKAHQLWLKGKKFRALRIAFKARRKTGIEIHPGAQLGRRIVMDHGMGIVIGETAVVGDDVLMYHGVTLGGTSLQSGAKRHPTIGNNVLLGAGCMVLGNVTIGDFSKVGAHSIAMEDAAPYTTIVGCRGRQIHNDPKMEMSRAEEEDAS